MKIAFVCDTIQAEVGGGITAARHVVNRLRREHEVTVIATDAYGEPQVTLYGFKLPLRVMRETEFAMARPDRAALARAIAAVDVVHLQLPFWLSFAALDEARKARRPVVASFNVQPENVLRNIGVKSKLLRRLGYRFSIERLYNRVDAVVCPTRFAERKLREHGLSARCFVISNGVPSDVGGWTGTREPELAGKFVVLTVGRFAAEKRQDLVIRAVARSRFRERIHLVVAGAGPREAELRRLMRKCAIAGEVGFLPRARLLQMLGTGDLSIHASEVELEGIAVLEAMQMALPVLIADGPETAAAEFALDDDFRFAGGEAALAQKLDALLAAPDKRARAGARYRQAANGLTVEASVQALLGVYRSVLES
jgi:1,2-diacylglycerol 3-alpha-glucosyltransferase